MVGVFLGRVDLFLGLFSEVSILILIKLIFVFEGNEVLIYMDFVFFFCILELKCVCSLVLNIFIGFWRVWDFGRGFKGRR